VVVKAEEALDARLREEALKEDIHLGQRVAAAALEERRNGEIVMRGG
jgi:hypothetical protein